jgi:hypothetical protein
MSADWEWARADADSTSCCGGGRGGRSRRAEEGGRENWRGLTDADGRAVGDVEGPKGLRLCDGKIYSPHPQPQHVQGGSTPLKKKTRPPPPKGNCPPAALAREMRTRRLRLRWPPGARCARAEGGRTWTMKKDVCQKLPPTIRRVREGVSTPAPSTLRGISVIPASPPPPPPRGLLQARFPHSHATCGP